MHYEIIVEGGRALECIGHLPSVYNVIVIFQLCSVIMINSGVDTVDVACHAIHGAMVIMTVEIILMR